MRLVSKFILSVSSLVLLSTGAQAEVFVWTSEDGHVSASFQDRWARVHNQSPSDLLTVKAPGDHDFATCKISAREDKRFEIYPIHYANAVQDTYYGEGLWKRHFADYNSIALHKVSLDAGLGSGFATMATASYETVNGPMMRKRSVAFASPYGGRLYIAECSAQEQAYDKWHKSFLSFVKSVEFKRTTNHALNGYYRDFIGDADYKVRGPTIFDDTYR